MNSSYVCTTCRRALDQARRQKALRWQSRATFISIGKTAPRTTLDRSDRPGPSGDEPIRPKENVEAGSNAPGRPTRRGKTKAKAYSGNTLESLFQDSLHPQSTQPRTSTSTSTSQPSTVLDLYKNVDTLRKMLLEGGNEADAWLFFVEHFGPNAEKHALDKSIVSRALLKDIILAKRKQPLSEYLPSVTEVSTISYQ